MTVADGDRCFLDPPDLAGAQQKGLATPTQRPQRNLAWKASFVTGNVGDSLTRSWTECGLRMEPCLELMMHPKISEAARVVAAGPAEDTSLWSSLALAQRTKAQGLSGWTPFWSQPSIPSSAGSWGKGPSLAHT